LNVPLPKLGIRSHRGSLVRTNRTNRDFQVVRVMLAGTGTGAPRSRPTTRTMTATFEWIPKDKNADGVGNDDDLDGRTNAGDRVPPTRSTDRLTYGLGVTSTLGGRGDGSGFADRRMIENATAPRPIIATPAAARTSGRGRRLGLRASAIT
jgi:hypothetical protein